MKLSIGRASETLAFQALRTDEARTNLIGLLRSIARRGLGLSNLFCLLVGRNALPEHPVHLTLGGDVSTSETPTAR
jgi:hypothetical protein